MNKDLIHILQSSQPRTENSYNAIRKYFNLNRRLLNTNDDIQIKKFDIGEVYAKDTNIENVNEEYSSLKGTVDKSLIDIDNCLKIIKESDQRKRIDEDKYNNSTIVEIPLSNINTDLKKSDSILVQFNTNLHKIEASCEKLKGKAGETLSNLMKKLYNKIIEYYTARISLLNKYFSKAKASFGAIKKNLEEKKNENNRSRSNLDAKGKAKIIKYDEEILNIYRKALNAETYKEYKPYYDELIKRFGIPISVIEQITHGWDANANHVIQVIYNEEEKHPIELNENMKLYHSSFSSDNIKQLEPRWKAAGGAIMATPRVYFHMGVPLDRYSIRNDKTPYFEPAIKITKVWSDKELGRTACYVETDKPIPVKPFDYSQFRKMRDIELSLDKQK